MSAVPYAQRRTRPNGWWGTAVFVASEATLFGTLLGSYFDLRLRAAHWPPAGVPEPKIALPLILTGVLVSTSVWLQLAVRGARAGRLGVARLGLALALILQAGYLAFQIHLYLDDLDRFSPQGSAYGSIYFTLVGAHHAHVFVGILLNAWISLRLVRGLSRYRLTGLEAITFYWNFVNVLAVIVTLVQISPAL
jgi:cytochrome o ubiquinol oxidase subunit 3